MGANTKVAGYKGETYIGAAGATAATRVSNSADDITVSYEEGRAETTTRGDGTAPPVTTHTIVSRDITSVKFVAMVRETDTVVETIMAAMAAGSPIAIRTKHHSAGKGVDGDFYIQAELGQPIKDTSKLTVTGYPTDDEGRTPLLWS